MMYYRGDGVSEDLATARAWIQKAAARGYAPAKEMLARLDEDVSVRPVRLQ
jgi:TPR repeat protein